MNKTFVVITVIAIALAYLLYVPRLDTKYLVVTMIKNEERHIAQMLQSTPPNSAYLICDTGSTDRSLAIVNATLDGRAHIVHHKWVNFGVNRNKCLAEARALLVLHPKDMAQIEWIVLIDADHEMQFQKLAPQFDQNLVKISGGTENHLPYIISRRALHECDYVLETHEVLICPSTLSRGILGGVVFKHEQHLGGNNAQKFTRDRDLLEAALKDPKRDQKWDNRRLFYLARTYEDLGDCKQATYYYERRASTGQKGDMEVFFSLYRIGVCALQQEASIPQIRDYFVKAIVAQVCRMEPYFYIAQTYRLNNDHEQCLIYATAGLHSPPCNTYQLFVETWIHRYGLLEEYALCLYYSGYKEQSHVMYLVLANMTDLPGDVRARITNSVEQTK